MKAGAAVSTTDELPNASRYEVLLDIASGGMGKVYIGRLLGPAGFWRYVAIKRPHREKLDDRRRAMLVSEALVASRIHHPNAVAVQDVDVVDDELVLVMDYVEGPSLAELVCDARARGARLPVDIVARIVLDAAIGLHAVHALADTDGTVLGLVHRDVTPQNILVGADGVSRIADFGIARVASPSHDETPESSHLLGKPAYMAPEYVDQGQVDARTDLFSLGIVAWEALTGERLFYAGEFMATVANVLGKAVPRPSSLVGPDERDAVAALDDIVLAALSKDPAARPPSALAFADALETAARGAGGVASSASVASVVRSHFGVVLEERRALLSRRVVEAMTVRDPLTRFAPSVQEVTAVVETARPRRGLDRMAPRDPRVDDLVAQGRAAYSAYWIDSILRAAELFERAHELAPDDPEVIGAFALALMRKFQFGGADERIAERARTLASRALAISPDITDARLTVSGLSLSVGNMAQAARELARIDARGRTEVNTREQYARIFADTGRLEDAVREFEKIRAASPERLHIAGELARAFDLLGDHARADELLAHIEPRHPSENLMWAARVRVQCFWRKDRARAAAFGEQLAERMIPMQGLLLAGLDAVVTGTIAPSLLRYLAGQAKAAGSSVRMACIFTQFKAELHGAIGDHDGALAALRESDDLMLIDTAWVELCPLFEALRADGRLDDVRRSVAARAASVVAELDAGERAAQEGVEETRIQGR